MSEVVGLPIYILTENEDPVAVSNRSCTVAELPDPAARLGIERLGVVAEHMARRLKINESRVAVADRIERK